MAAMRTAASVGPGGDCSLRALSLTGDDEGGTHLRGLAPSHGRSSQVLCPQRLTSYASNQGTRCVVCEVSRVTLWLSSRTTGEDLVLPCSPSLHNTSRRTASCRCSGVAPLLSTASLSLSLPYFTCRNAFATYTGLSLFPEIPPCCLPAEQLCCPASIALSGVCLCHHCFPVWPVSALCQLPRMTCTAATSVSYLLRSAAAERNNSNIMRNPCTVSSCRTNESQCEADWRSMANAGRGPRKPIHNRAGLAGLLGGRPVGSLCLQDQVGTRTTWHERRNLMLMQPMQGQTVSNSNTQ
jgi:hypothetical protein